MRLTTRTGSVIATLAVALTASLGIAPAARAAGGDDGGKAPSKVATTKVRSCRLYGGEAGFGMVCRKYAGGRRTVEQILGGAELPECWQEPLSEDLRAEYAADIAQREELGPQGRFVVKTCLSGIDPVTLEVTGEVEFTQTVIWLGDGDPGPPELTPGQQRLVDFYQRDDTIPLPEIVADPTNRPRVGQNVTFSVVNARKIAPEAYVRPNGGIVRMQARLTDLYVTPEPGARRSECTGGGVAAARGDTPDTFPRGQACWWRFDRSSASQPEGTYPVLAEARWVIEWTTGDEWHELTSFFKEQTWGQPVTEVQTVAIR